MKYRGGRHHLAGRTMIGDIADARDICLLKADITTMTCIDTSLLTGSLWPMSDIDTTPKANVGNPSSQMVELAYTLPVERPRLTHSSAACASGFAKINSA